jgi:prepilin-type N-terminal cleavage/methylation domain-containing protein
MARTNPSPRGFSLIELVVAMLFVGLLMAGMMRVYSASIRSFHSQQETLGAQRMNRLAFDQLSDDFQQAGYMYPDRSVAPWITAGAVQKSFVINPGQTFTAQKLNDAGALVGETITADEVVFARDVPVARTATLAGAVGPGAGVYATLPLAFTPGAATPILKGDIVILWDQNFEFFFVKDDLGAGNTVTIDPDGHLIDSQWITGANGEVRRDHALGTQVSFVRPNQLVRYSLQPIALDPAVPGMTVPCLVRQQATYPMNTTVAVNWTTTQGTVLAENISGFRVDMSADGGTTWTRAATWAAWKTALDPKLKAQNMKGYQGMDLNPLWFKFANLVFRLDITSRTPTQRSEFTGSPLVRAFRERTLTMLLMPRNFALGL